MSKAKGGKDKGASKTGEIDPVAIFKEENIKLLTENEMIKNRNDWL